MTMKEQAPAALTDIALMVLKKRYLIKDDHGRVTETPETMFRRVADTIAAVDARYGATPDQVRARSNQFYRLMTEGLFEPNSPTLMNAGRPLAQLSACFVLPVADDLTSIYETLKHQALIHQSGGGTGFSFSRLRPRNDIVRSTMGVASGPVSFMDVYNHSTEAIKQGGTRRGANMGILRVDHPDILEFITIKQDLSKVTNFNISVAITDAFMQAVVEDTTYDLINPRTGELHVISRDGLKNPLTGEVLVEPGQPARLRARYVFDMIVRCAHATGEPGLFFIDRANAFNPVPHLALYEATNPCGEQPLIAYDVCLAEGTRVLTERGYMPIEDLVGTSIRIASVVEERIVYQAPLKVFSNGRKPTYRLELADRRTLTLTGNHQVLTERGWVRTDELQLNDRVKINAYTPDELPVLDLDPEFYMLGWLTGDGWFTDKRGFGFVFGCDADAQSEQVITSYMRSSHDIGYIQEQENGVRCLHIDSERLKRNFVLRYGITPARAIAKRVPTAVFTAPRQQKLSYLAGLFAADGTAKNNRPNVSLSSSSHELLQDVQLLLDDLGIYSWIGRYELVDRNDQGILVINGPSLDRFAKYIGFGYSHSKQELLVSRLNGRQRLHPNPKSIAIRSLAQDQEQEVFDISLPEHHHFIAEGMIVHNCNLGSINLGAFVNDGAVDWDALREVVHQSTRFLDNVIDANHYPLPEIAALSQRIRRIGLGVMGWADMLIRLGIPYNSAEATELGRQVMGFVDEESKVASERIAAERGMFPEWERSIWGPDATCARDKDGNRIRPERKLRNCNVTTVAPTGTISIIAGCSSGIEPIFAVAFWRYQADARMLDINPDFVARARREGWYSEELMARIADSGHIHHPEVPDAVQRAFVTAHDISPEWHIRMQGAFQEYTDSAISKTCNFPYEATPEDIRAAYELAFSLGCKGVTVYRDGSRSNQVLSTGATSKPAEPKAEPMPEAQAAAKQPPAQETPKPLRPRKVPTDGLPSHSYPVETPLGKLRLFVTELEGQPFEVFAIISRSGSDVSAFTEAIGRLLSLALRCGIPVRLLAEQLRGIGGSRSAGFGPSRVRSVPDAIGKLLQDHYVNGERPQGNGNGNSNGHVDEMALTSYAEIETRTEPLAAGELCPDCQNATLMNEEGCRKCHTCGYAEC
jgi:ribonucleoside-diphosphate reductase alpha chain